MRLVFAWDDKYVSKISFSVFACDNCGMIEKDQTSENYSLIIPADSQRNPPTGTNYTPEFQEETSPPSEHEPKP